MTSQYSGHELGQILEDGEGQRGLACCSPWGHKELDTTGGLNKKTTPTIVICRILYMFNM